MIENKIKLDIFNIGFLSTIYFFCMFILPGILGYLRIGGNIINGNMIWVEPKAFLFSTFCITIFSIIFFKFKYNFKESEVMWENNNACLSIFALILLGISIKIYRLFNGSYLSYMYANIESPIFIYQYLISLNILFYIALSISFIQYYKLLIRNNPTNIRFFKYLSWSQFYIYLLLTIFTSGSKFYIAFIILIPTVARYYICRDISNSKIIKIIIIISLIFPIKNVLKDVTIAQNYFNIDVKVNTQWNERGILNYFFHNQNNYFYISEPEIPRKNDLAGFYLDNTIGRINQLHVFSILIDKTQDNFLHGKTFYSFLSTFGFSSEYIQKLSGIGDGSNFAITSGLSDNNLTGIGSTSFGDAYQNFGLTGLISYSIILAVLLKIFYVRFSNPINSTNFLYYVYLTPLVIHAYEQSISSSLANFVRLSLVIYSINFILNAKRLFKII
jgi:hypothetical protein